MDKKNKIILYLASSIDGYIARKNGSVDWLEKYDDSSNDPKNDFGYKDFFDSIDTVIVGNTTQTQYPQKYDGKKTFVFSRTKEGSYENLTYVKGNVKDFMKTYKPKGNIWLVGGTDLHIQFLEADLIDEFIITIIPDILGDGIPLFNKSEFTKELKLKEINQFGNLVQLHYTK